MFKVIGYIIVGAIVGATFPVWLGVYCAYRLGRGIIEGPPSAE
jgi:hypothetical protein